MKLNILLVLISILFTTHTYGQDQVVGDWYAEQLDNSTIQIYKESEAYYGKIIRSDVATYVGKTVLTNIKYNAEADTWTGIIQSPKRNIDIDGTISFEPDGKLKIVGRKFFLTKTFYWVRE